MKKLMILAVIAVTALATQAATINWMGVDLMNPFGTTGDGYAGDDTVLWLFSVGDTFGAGGFDGLFDPDAQALAGGTDITSKVDGGKIVYNLTLGTASFSYSGDAADLEGWYAVVAWDPDSSDYYGIYVFSAPLIDELAGAFNATAVSGKTLTFAHETGVVPEPLTVGLALAGVALLIAQRKRK